MNLNTGQLTVQDRQAALAFVRREGTYVESQVYEDPMTEIQYPSLVPVDTSAPAWSDVIEYTQITKAGKAKWFQGDSDDVPLAQVATDTHQSGVHMAAMGYGWGYEEIHKAMYHGKPLTTWKAMAARRAAEEFIDELVFYGDATKGYSGFFNNPAVTAAPVPNGGWLAAIPPTEDQIIADMVNVLIDSSNATNYTSIANTILIPHPHMLVLSKRLGDTNSNIYEFIMKSNPYTMATGQQLTLRAVYGLETAGVGGTGRMVAYRNDRDVMVLHMPMPFTFLPPYHEDVMNWVVPGIFRLGGLEIRRPAEIRFGDGI